MARPGVHLIAAVSLGLFGAARSAPAQTVDHIASFAPADLVFSKVREYDFVEVRADRSSNEGTAGEPWLPVRDVHILLPAGTRVAALRATVAGEMPLDGNFRICPAQPPIPISEMDRPHPFVEPNKAVYASESALPADAAALVDTVIIRGHPVALVRVHPLAYVPATGRLTLRTTIRLRLELKPAVAPEAVRYKSRDPVFEAFVREQVSNPDMATVALEAPPSRSPVDANDVKYLLIGDAAMFDEFQPLLDWKTKKGVPAEAVSVAWIDATYAGADTQERIKACIKDYVQNKGTVWVCLAGDNTIVPDRDCYCIVYSPYELRNIPTDLYYAGLDDMNWDDDGDTSAAEVLQDTIDMGPDVFVGRLPIRTEAHATAVVNKILQYERNPAAADFAEKMLLSGDRLWTTGDAEGKSEYLWSGWIAPYWNGTRFRFYDTDTDHADGPLYDVTPDHMDEQLANGYNYLHMATHGSSSLWAMEGSSYNASHAGSVSNPGLYTNIGTIACHTNAFDSSDPALSEGFIRNPNGGAVSYFGSSRWGWGVKTLSSHGTSFQYDRMFYEFLFTGVPTTCPQQLGAVYARMKEYWIGSCGSYGSKRWCQLAINLMGDPEMCLYTCDPLTIVPSYATAVAVGPQAYTVETGVPNATVCLWKGGEVYTYGHADETGVFTACVSPLTSGTMQVTITAPNHYPHEGMVLVLLGSAGVFFIEEDVCNRSDTLHLRVADLDLQGRGVQTVTMTSDAGDSETVALVEAGAGSGIFMGTVATSPDPVAVGDGRLQAAHGDTITGTYEDLDDGTSSPAVVQDTAVVDGLAPVISNVQVAFVTKKSAIITFETDEVSTDRIRCGLAAGGPYPIIGTDNNWATTHSIHVTGLTRGTTYYFEIDAGDGVQNTATDDNGGPCYSFTTVANWTVPFFDGFESGTVDKWDVNVGASGNTPLVTADSTLEGGLSPRSGAYAAYLGDSTTQYSSRSTMDLVIDLAGHEWVELNYGWATLGLERYDCVRLDIWDGTWHPDVNNWAYQGHGWEQRTLDLSRFNLIDGFVIRFHGSMSSTEPHQAAYVDDVSVVVPDILRVTPNEMFVAGGPDGGPFTPSGRSYTLTNIGTFPLDWAISSTPPWLDVTPTSGTALAPSASRTVTVSIGPAATGLPPGIHPGSLTVSNLTTSYSQTRDVELAVETYAAMPFLEDFEDSTPTLKPYWRVTGSGPSRTRVDTQNEPHGGSYHLTMDTPDYDVHFARNELTLGIDLEGWKDVVLSFWARTYGGTPQGPPPSPFSIGADFDGIAISEDGMTWYEVRGLRDMWRNYEKVTIDLDTAVAALGLSYNATFKIRFNQYGQYPIAAEGLAIDDIRIDGEKIDDLNVAPRVDTTVVGHEGGPFLPSEIGYTLSNDGTSTLGWTSTCTAAWLDANPRSGTLAPGTSVTVIASVNTIANGLTTGTHSGSVVFQNAASLNTRTRTVLLTVSPLLRPPPPRAPQPGDGATGVVRDTHLSWLCGTTGLWNGSFETGDFTGWTTVTGSGWATMPWDVVTSGWGMFGNGYPVHGLCFAQNGFEGSAGMFYELYQEVGIPRDVTSALFRWSERIQWYSRTGGGNEPLAAERRYEVTLQPAGGGAPLAELYCRSLPNGVTSDTGYVSHAVDLMSAAPGIAGRAVRIDFHEWIPEDWMGPAQFDLDDIDLVFVGPSGPAYDVYFDTSDPPVTLIAGGLVEPTCDPGTLDPAETYYWRVVARNSAGSTSGPVWSFTTVDESAIACAPTSLSVVCDEESGVASGTLTVWNALPPGQMHYTIHTEPTWLCCTPTAGTSAGQVTTHTVAADIAALNAADYKGTITIACAEAINSPVHIPVSLTVNAVPPRVSIAGIAPNPAQPPSEVITFDGLAADGAGTITAQQWHSDIEGVLSLEMDFATSAGALTVGDHAITFTAWDDEGTSASDAGTLAVLNAVPSARILTLSPNPIAAGTTATIVLAGHDNDEAGQALADGELTLPEGIVAGVLSGECAFAAPETQDDYVIAYRVEDDEGTWSPPSTATLHVIQPQIACSMTSLTVECVEGGSPATTTLVVWNGSSPGTLEYEIHTSPTWLTCLPAGGSSAGQPTTHTIHVDPGRLNCGDYPVTITIIAARACNGPIAMPVAVHIRNATPVCAIDGGTTAPVQPPMDAVHFAASGSDAAGSIAGYEWRSDLDGVLSHDSGFSTSSNNLTVGTHRITVVVWDDEGSSASAETSVTVLNALPTAGLVSLWPSPAMKGTTVTVHLQGSDNDELGGSLIDGVLIWPGGTFGGILPGLHEFTVPQEPSAYAVQYRVQDDEGEWSEAAIGTLRVVEHTDAGRWMLYR